MQVRKIGWLSRWLFSSIVCLAATADAHASLVYESRAPGANGGGNAVGTNIFPGQTFRFTERTQVTAIGAYLSAFTNRTVFSAIYQLDTPDSNPDVATDSNLLGATLLSVPGGSPTNVSGPLSLTLEPGWYSIITGTGRHGATAPNFAVTHDNTGTPASTQSWRLPYVMNATTNARSYQSSTLRFFVEGDSLPAAPAAPHDFLMETARSSARTNASYYLHGNNYWATTFDVGSTTAVHEVGSWMAGGSGHIFAAIVELPASGANPLSFNHPGFLSTVVGTTLIEVGDSPQEYAGDFGGLQLAPGSYSLILGSGRFGATGSAEIMEVTDQVVSAGSRNWNGSAWTNAPDVTFRMALAGTVIPEPGTAALGGAALIAAPIMRRRKLRPSPGRKNPAR